MGQGRALFVLSCWILAAGIAVAAIIGGLTKPETTTISGTATATCETLRTRPIPHAFTVDGAPLAGDGWMGQVLGNGMCSTAFLIQNVQVLGSYTVTAGTMTTTVAWVDTANVKLVER